MKIDGILTYLKTIKQIVIFQISWLNPIEHDKMEVFPSKKSIKIPRHSHGQISVATRNRIYRELPPVTPEIIERWATQRS